MSGRHRSSARDRAARRQAPWSVLALALAGVSAAVIVQAAGSPAPRSPGSTAPSPPLPAATVVATKALHPPPACEPWLSPAPAGLAGQLRDGSELAVLPTALLIADMLNNRLIVINALGLVRRQFPQPGDLSAHQTFCVSAAGFFTPDGRYIIATQEDRAVISIIDIARHRITYRYDIPGQPGRCDTGRSMPSNSGRQQSLTCAILISAHRCSQTHTGRITRTAEMHADNVSQEA